MDCKLTIIITFKNEGEEVFKTIKSLKEKYHTDNDKEVISKMDLEEKIKYIDLISKYNNASEKYCYECDKISNNYEKRWKK